MSLTSVPIVCQYKCFRAAQENIPSYLFINNSTRHRRLRPEHQGEWWLVTGRSLVPARRVH